MNYNRVILGGRLTRDPELRYIQSGTAVVELGIAINRKWGEKEETCFVDCTAWGKTGETIAKFLKKGDPIHLEGRLTFDSWTDKQGQKRSKLKVTVDQFQFVGGKSEGATTGRTRSDAPNPCRANPAPAATATPIDDEDIPF